MADFTADHITTDESVSLLEAAQKGLADDFLKQRDGSLFRVSAIAIYYYSGPKTVPPANLESTFEQPHHTIGSNNT